MTSVAGWYGQQSFTDSGAPLAGGRLYTLTYGTTAHKTAYTDFAATVPHTYVSDGIGGLYIALDARGELPAPLYLTAGSYDMALKRADGSTVWTKRADPTTTVSDLADAGDSTTGAGLVGFLYSLNYAAGTIGAWLKDLANSVGSSFIGFTQGTGGITRTVQTELRERGLPSVKAYGAVGDGVTNDLAAIQAAYAVNSDVYWPNGTYNLGGNTWTPPASMRMVGQSRRGVKLARTGAGPLITFPINSFDPYIENIEFTGTGNTGITVDTTAGPFQGYLIRPHITNCDFDVDLAYGINADLIFATVEKSTFGYYGTASPAPGASTFVAIKSYFYPATTNFTNLNTVRNCIFQRAGSLTAPAVNLSGGASWTFDSCDWESGGVVLSTSNVQMLKFIGSNWIEGNVATNGLMSLGASTVQSVFDGVNFSNNACRSIFEFTVGATKGLTVKNCDIGKATGTYCLFDTIALSTLLPGDGSVAFHDNHVTGDTVSDKCVTGTDFRGGATQPRMTGRFTSTGPVTNVCSDPGIAISRNSAGDVSITSSHPFGTSTSTIRVVATGTSGAVRAGVVNTSQIRLQAYALDGTNGAAEDTFNVAVYGS